MQNSHCMSILLLQYSIQGRKASVYIIYSHDHEFNEHVLACIYPSPSSSQGKLLALTTRGVWVIIAQTRGHGPTKWLQDLNYQDTFVGELLPISNLWFNLFTLRLFKLVDIYSWDICLSRKDNSLLVQQMMSGAHDSVMLS